MRNYICWKTCFSFALFSAHYGKTCETQAWLDASKSQENPLKPGKLQLCETGTVNEMKTICQNTEALEEGLKPQLAYLQMCTTLSISPQQTCYTNKNPCG